MWKCLYHSVHHASSKVTKSYVHPSPTENKRSRSHPRIGIAVSIIPCVISISKSMPLLNSRMDGCLIWHSKIYARMLWLLHTWLHMFQRSFFILIFRLCINHKNCHLTFHIQFSKTDVCWAYNGLRVKKLKGQNIEGSKHWRVKTLKNQTTVSERKYHSCEDKYLLECSGMDV